MSDVPFTEQIISEKEKIRTFSDSSSQKDFNWHLDRNDRKVHIIKAGSGWGVQFDNQLPQKLKTGDNIVVPAFKWHRVIRGNGDLVIRIIENN